MHTVIVSMALAPPETRYTSKCKLATLKFEVEVLDYDHDLDTEPRKGACDSSTTALFSEFYIEDIKFLF